METDHKSSFELCMVKEGESSGECMRDIDFWDEAGHFLLLDAATSEEIEWLQETNAAHGRAVGHGPAGFSGSSNATGFLSDGDRASLRRICGRVLQAVAKYDSQPHYLDLAIVSQTAACGHKPHVDNEKLVQHPDGTCSWVPGNSGHRTWSVSLMLSAPAEYGDGELIFFEMKDAKRRPRISVKEEKGVAVIFRGDHHHAHAVNPISWGTRLVLLIFLRGSPDPPIPRLYTRAGVGRAVYLEPSVKEFTPGLCFLAWVGLMRSQRAFKNPGQVDDDRCTKE